jgi:hypothetical protein
MKLNKRLDKEQAQANSPFAELKVARRMVQSIKSSEERLKEVLLFAGMNPNAFIMDVHANPVS